MQAMAASEQQLLESSQQLQQEMKRLMQQALALEHTLLHHQCTNARGGLTPREVEQLSIDLRAVHAGTYVEPQDLGDSNAAPAASRESAPPRSSAVAALRSSILHKRRSAAQPSPPAGPESEVGHVSSRNAAIPQPPPQPKRLSAKLSKKQQIGG
ncbi:hypothetical protein CAOG_008291 [Capsaspora owczarzaki ATCC 30864]|uniref:Uncharacterized protein n=2 Tax=Capsaspora owczarzaki (strain ATCC 30864) TaxID=595528 RepID=A0A0D2WYW9_CAPO3|nr:hypothetical protein CAOG_008291 [Capsaspora owczarzaki ATCC 30864]